MATQPRLAAAVMLVRDTTPENGIEVFMVRRIAQSAFMPDVYVFPGGSVSSGDCQLELQSERITPFEVGLADPEGRTAPGLGTRAAAIRELFEEAGVLLVYDQKGELLVIDEENMPRFAAYRQSLNARTQSLLEIVRAEQLVLAAERLHYFAHWITPEGMPKRFDTHFFIATTPAAQQATYDQLETSEGVWISPARALVQAEQGDFPLVFATIYQLRELAAFSRTAELLQSSQQSYVRTNAPILIQRDGQAHVHLPDEPDLWAVPEYMTRHHPE